MKLLNELKPNTVFKVIGGERPIHYWLYTGKHASNRPCSTCGKTRNFTHEFLHYESLDELEHDLLINDLGRFDQNYQFGTECVKDFASELSTSEIIQLKGV